MDPDMNKYDLEHVLTAHPVMSPEEWSGIYRDAWSIYYSDEHVATVLRRGIASGLNPRKIVDALTIFSGATRIEGVHPLQFGFVRRKLRTQRRSSLPIEHPLIFYPRRALEAALTLGRWFKLARRYRGIMKRVMAEAGAASYVDLALEPPTADHALPDFVQTFADKIPKTHGAPVQERAAAG